MTPAENLRRMLRSALLCVLITGGFHGGAIAQESLTNDELISAAYAQGRLAFQQRCSVCHTLANRGANLAGADLSGSDLEGADFRGAILSGVDLSGAALSATRFDGARVEGVVFNDSWGLVEAQEAYFNDQGVLG